jgi:hypothetical protein
MVVSTIFLGALASPALAQTLREESDKTYEARSLTGLRVENARGVVRVFRGEPGKVRVRALKLVRSGERDEAARYSRETTVVTSVASGRMQIRVRYPQRQKVRVSFWDMMKGYEFPRVEVRLEVHAPENLALDLASNSGDLATEAMAGAQNLETTSGDITIDGGRAPVRAHSLSGTIDGRDLPRARLESASGDVLVAGARAALEIGTSSGDVTVKGAEDSLEIEAVSGDVQVDQAPRGADVHTTSGNITIGTARGALRIDTGSGDVTFGLLPPLDFADVTTVSGDVTASLSEALGCKLQMHTTSGAIDVSAPVRLSVATRTRVEGQIGDGRATVKIGSSSGDLSLTSGETP